MRYSLWRKVKTCAWAWWPTIDSTQTRVIKIPNSNLKMIFKFILLIKCPNCSTHKPQNSSISVSENPLLTWGRRQLTQVNENTTGTQASNSYTQKIIFECLVLKWTSYNLVCEPNLQFTKFTIIINIAKYCISGTSLPFVCVFNRRCYSIPFNYLSSLLAKHKTSLLRFTGTVTLSHQ